MTKTRLDELNFANTLKAVDQADRARKKPWKKAPDVVGYLKSGEGARGAAERKQHNQLGQKTKVLIHPVKEQKVQEDFPFPTTATEDPHKIINNLRQQHQVVLMMSTLATACSLVALKAASDPQFAVQSQLASRFRDVMNRAAQFAVSDPRILQQAMQKINSPVPHVEEIRAKLTDKAEKHEIPIKILAEVFMRGCKAYDPQNEKINRNEYAFNRVNSFIAGGAAAQMDKDLIETLSKRESWQNLNTFRNSQFVKITGKRLPHYGKVLRVSKDQTSSKPSEPKALEHPRTGKHAGYYWPDDFEPHKGRIHEEKKKGKWTKKDIRKFWKGPKNVKAQKTYITKIPEEKEHAKDYWRIGNYVKQNRLGAEIGQITSINHPMVHVSYNGGVPKSIHHTKLIHATGIKQKISQETKNKLGIKTWKQVKVEKND